ncbi:MULTISPECIES: VCBS repeat-containing protein [unclassified Pseudoxanthomonas]|uniref:FG-GAP repeat domain-containing protein n=1 Tax=unclassified Pseudoxanthomonas TaxID=2645906 RepID=UPI003076FE95
MGSLKIFFWLFFLLMGAVLGLWFRTHPTTSSTSAEPQEVASAPRWSGGAQPLPRAAKLPTSVMPADFPEPVLGGASPPKAALASALLAPGFYFDRVIVSPVVVDVWPDQVVVADVTGDGRNDIVLAIDALLKVVLRIHAQNADGTLADAIDLMSPIMATSGGGGSVEAVDLNNDGLPEIVVGAGQGLTVFRKTSGGYAYQSYVGNVRSLSLGAIDLDGDGHRDIFAQGWEEGADIYLSDRHGGFRGAQRIATPLSGYNTLEISDFTADGIADVVMTNGQGWPKVVVYPAAFFGGLQSLIEIPMPAVQTMPSFGMTVADMDRDGRPDLVMPDEGNASASLRGIHVYYRGEGNSIRRHEFLHFQGMYQRPGAVQVADIDGNGYPDIVAMMNSYNQMAYILQGPSGFGEPVFQTTSDNAWTNSHYMDNSFVIADVNSDRCPDIVLAESSSSLRVFYGRNCQLPVRQTGGPLPARRG